MTVKVCKRTPVPLSLCLSLSASLLFSYLKEFGFTIPERPIMVDDIRVRGSGKSGIRSMTTAKSAHGHTKPTTVRHGTQIKPTSPPLPVSFPIF